MEHACENCGAQVSADSPFCANCGAAQIHFAERRPASIPVAIAAGTTPPVLIDHALSTSAGATEVSSWRAAFRSAIIAGSVAAVLSMLPIGPAFVLALPFAGFLSVLIYSRYNRGAEPTLGIGFRIGAAAGLAGFIILTVLTAIETLAFHGENELRSALVQAVKQSQERYADPQARQALEFFMTPDGLIYLMIVGSLFMCLLFVIFSGIGGAISASLLRRRQE